MDSPKLDSAEGIAILVAWARVNGFVLASYHKRIADKHGVDTSGVIFTGRVPTK